MSAARVLRRKMNTTRMTMATARISARSDLAQRGADTRGAVSGHEQVNLRVDHALELSAARARTASTTLMILAPGCCSDVRPLMAGWPL
jgi:hypothetical protein